MSRHVLIKLIANTKFSELSTESLEQIYAIIQQEKAYSHDIQELRDRLIINRVTNALIP